MQFYACLQATGHRQQVSVVVTVCGLLANGYKDSGASLVAHLPPSGLLPTLGALLFLIAWNTFVTDPAH